MTGTAMAGRTPGTEPGRTVAVVGAGFSGTMAAIQLRRALPGHDVVLFDRAGRFARGAAYAATPLPYLLNVRAANMSALPDDPGHYERWLAEHASVTDEEAANTEAGTFTTRRLYGRYLRSLLKQELASGHVHLLADDVVDLDDAGGRWRVQTASGRTVDVASVVIAAGNLPSREAGTGTVFHDPWAPGTTAGLHGAEPVLVVGTGLTMVDLVLGMRLQGFAGPIVAVSRRGLVPLRHAAPGPARPAPAFTGPERRSMTALMRRVRTEVREATTAGSGWRAVVDGLRPVTPALWQGLPDAERARFLRHLRPYWDVHRHRLAPPAADAFQHQFDTGSLTLRRGRVAGIEPRGRLALAVIQDRAGRHEITVQRVIFATGPGQVGREAGLLAALIRSGFARPDAQGLGLQATPALELVGRAGTPTPGLWALGPIVRGMTWESTAVPDIRVQARSVAAGIAAQVSAGDGPA